MSTTLRTALLATLLLAPACVVGDVTGGGGGGGGGDDTTVGGDDTTEVGPDAAPAPDFAASMTPATIDTTLGTTSHYTVTLDSMNYTGSVLLAATGVPEGWTATFTPSTVSLPLDGTITADLAIMVPTDGIAATATIGVTATAGPGARTASSSLVVENEYIFTIGNVGTGNHNFPGTLRLPLGAKLTIKNGDTIGHRVHSDGGAGFPHQDATMPGGASYTVTPGDVGGYTFYCHDHGVGAGVTNLVVQ